MSQHPKDQYLKFFITFHSVMLVDCPPQLQGKQCLLKYVRGRNELETKKSVVDKGGLAEFNERIEMKTFLEYDESKDRYKAKLSNLFAVLHDGAEKRTLGSCTVDLADFAKPTQHQKQIILTDNLLPGVNHKSHIQLMVDTSPAKDKGRESQIVQPGASSRQQTQKQTANATKNSKLLQEYEKQIKELEASNVDKKTDNEKMKKLLVESDLFHQVEGAQKSGDANQSFEENFKFKGRDNEAKYKKLPAANERDVKQLLKLDKEIERLFERQFKMTNKNEEMLTNKLNDLDDKTILRDYLFKEVGNKQLQNDIDEIKGFIKKNACAV